MQTQQDLIPIDSWNQAGLADSRFSGVKNSFYKMLGWDVHSTPGLLKVAQKMTKDSGTTITALCRASVSSSENIRYWFSYTDGKIWQEKAGTYTLVHTTTAGAGTHGCLGAIEYRGFIYFATQSRLHRIAVGSADGSAAWTSNVAEDWATFTTTDTEFHPMVEQNLILYIGDGNQLAQVDNVTFSASALDIKTPLRIKSLGKTNTDVLIGTYVADTVTETEIIRWNTWSVSFTSSDTIPENGINAFLPGDNFVIVQAGNQGNFYYYDGSKLELYKKLPGDWSPTKYGTVHPNAVGRIGERILFGLSNGSGNPTEQGVYQFARNSRNYPLILDLPYPISERSTGSLVTSGIEIGAIQVVGNDIYCSWKNSTTYGIDKLDYSNKLSLGYLETRTMVVNREALSTFTKFVTAYYSLPASTSIVMGYDKNHTGAYTTMTSVLDTQRKIYEAGEGVEATTLQFRLSVTVNSNDAPEIESAGIFLS